MAGSRRSRVVDRAECRADGHDSPMRGRRARTSGEGLGRPVSWLLDLCSRPSRRKGRQYRPISAATITNSTHKNSEPRIHKLSEVINNNKQSKGEQEPRPSGSRSATRPTPWRWSR